MKHLQRIWFQALCVFVLSFSFFLYLQSLSPNIIDGDGYYHIRIAQMMRHDWVIDRLPQAEFTIFRDHFSDKEFLFHLFLMPFTLMDLNAGAKLATALLASTFVVTLFWILRANGLTWAIFAVLALPALSPRFIFTLLTPRPHLLSIILVFLSIDCMIRGKRKLLFLTSFLQSLSYTAWHLIPGLGLIFGIVQVIRRRSFDLSFFVISLGGALLGLAIHPHPFAYAKIWFLQNGVFYLHLFGFRPLLSAGQEMSHLGLFELWRSFPVEICLLGVAILLQPIGKRRFLFWGVSSFVFLLMTLGTIKFCHYLSPSGFLFFALTLQDLSETTPVRGIRYRRPIYAALTAAFILIAGFLSRSHFQRFQELRQWPPVYFASEIQALEEHVPKGAFLFHCDWLSATVLFFYRPDLRFPLLLDPIFAYYGEREKTELWMEACAGEEPPMPSILAIIQPDYFLLTPYDQGLTKSLQSLPQATKVWANNRLALYSVQHAPFLGVPRQF